MSVLLRARVLEVCVARIREFTGCDICALRFVRKVHTEVDGKQAAEMKTLVYNISLLVSFMSSLALEKDV